MNKLRKFGVVFAVAGVVLVSCSKEECAEPQYISVPSEAHCNATYIQTSCNLNNCRASFSYSSGTCKVTICGDKW
jgi:hypothetical protein